MKSEKYPRAAKRAVRLMTLTLLLVSAFGVVVPQICQAQNPSLAGIWCPACKGYISCPSGKRPAACPNPQCRYSFVQKAKPMMSPQLHQNLPQSTTYQPPDAHDARLYYDGPVTAGGLQTRHFDPDGMAARVEALVKERKQVNEQSLKKQEARSQAFENDKYEILNSQKTGPTLHVFEEDSNLEKKRDDWLNQPNGQDLVKYTPPEVYPLLYPEVSAARIAEKKREVESLEQQMKALQKKRLVLIEKIEELEQTRASVVPSPEDIVSAHEFKTEHKSAKVSPTLVSTGDLLQEFYDQEEESLSAAMGYKTGYPVKSTMTLVDVKKAELRNIKAQQIETGNRLQAAKEALAELEQQKRLGEEHRNAVAPKNPK